MLAPIKHVLNTKRIVLASGSKQRQELLKTLGINADICPSGFPENLNPKAFDTLSHYVEQLAVMKAEGVFKNYTKLDDPSKLIVIAADTIVTFDDEIYGKPKSAMHAISMLSKFSGNCTRCYTGVVIQHANEIRAFTESTDVYFGNLTQEQIKVYVDSGEWCNKAGGFGIQGTGGSLISKIVGDYYCVVGLPLHRLCIELCKLFENGINNIDKIKNEEQS